MAVAAAIWQDLKLRQGTREPGALRVNGDSSAAVLTGIVTHDVLEEILNTGIETAVADNSTGRLRRTNPIAHPERSSLFLSAFDNIVGVSFVEKVASDPEGYLEIPAMPFRSSYEKYEVQCTFTPRPYVQVQDESIPPCTISWYDITGAPQTKSGYKEWWRNCVWTRQPAAEYLTAEYGFFTFSNPGAAPGVLPKDNAPISAGTFRQLLPSSTWHCDWYGVPYSYCLSTNTYWDRLQGHVNQREFEGFTPGEALLMAVQVTRVYSPPFPDFITWEGSDVVSQNKLCDVRFIFHSVLRTPTTAVTPTNPNHIVAGHNCVYFGSAAGGKAYYAENFRGTGSAGTGVPNYPSANFELLFQNPDGPA
jgi:hypothetical protein